jgi:hypothetical protein
MAEVVDLQTPDSEEVEATKERAVKGVVVPVVPVVKEEVVVEVTAKQTESDRNLPP